DVSDLGGQGGELVRGERLQVSRACDGLQHPHVIGSSSSARGAGFLPGAGAGLQPSLFPPPPWAHDRSRCQRADGYAAFAPAPPGAAGTPPGPSAGPSAVPCAPASGAARRCRTSGTSMVSAEATTISAAAPYWVADTPTAAAIGPASSAPRGIADTEPMMS